MRLQHMTDAFPGLPSSPPLDYENDFDYGRWGDDAATFHLCNCPWGTSEVMVGQRNIMGQGNVVYFDGGKDERDEWFDALDDVTWTAPYRRLEQGSFKLPIPFDMVCRYNYLWVEFRVATSDDAPIDGETADGMRKVFYFIRDISADDNAPSTTNTDVLMDYWTTWVYDVEFYGMMLERGHWAVANTSVEDFLTSPVENSDYLLDDDVQPSSTPCQNTVERVLIDGDGTYAVIALKASVSGIWTEGRVPYPNGGTWTRYGGSAYMIVCIDVSNLREYLDDWCEYPNFGACVAGIYFMPMEFCPSMQSETFLGHTVYYPSGGNSSTIAASYTFEKSDFAYPDEYANLAKLYTSPYARLNVCNLNGDGYTVDIQQCRQRVDIEVLCTVAAPNVGMSARVLGIGSADSNVNITVTPLSHSIRYTAQGMEHDYDIPLDCPVFGYCVSNYDIFRSNNDYEIDWERTYNETNYDLNMDAADLIVSNQQVANNASAANTATANDANTNATENNINRVNADTANSMSYLYATTDLSNEANYATTLNNNAAAVNSAKIDAGASIASASVGTAASIASGAAAGSVVPGVGTVAGAIGGAVSGGINLASTAISAGASVASAEMSAQYATCNALITNTTNSAITEETVDLNNTNADNSALLMRYNQTIVNDCNTEQTSTSNAAALTQANANAQQARNVATNDYNRNVDDYEQRYDTAHNLPAVEVAGWGGDGVSLQTVPRAIEVNVVTMGSGDIRRIGDQFLRWGYECHAWVQPGTFNVMDRFTYWKCENVQANYQFPDAFADRIRILLMGGITVWRRPEYIATTTIYDNGV